VRVLVVAPQPFFSPRGTPFSVYYRTLVAAELGASIDLLTYGEGEDVDIPGVRIIRIPRFPWVGPIRIGPSWPKLFLDVVLLAWTVALLARNRYDVVHAHEEAVFFCRFLKPIFGFKLIYDMHSSLPQQLRNFRFSSSRALISLFDRLEGSSLRAADAVITICPDLAKHAVRRIRDPGRHFLIENSIFEPVRLRADAPRRAAGALAPPELPGDRPIVLYAGTFEPYQGLDILLPAFARVRASRPDALLVLAGGQPAQVDRYRRLAEEEGVAEACVFTGVLEQEAVRQLVRRAAVLTSPRTAGLNTPLKIYEQLASGIPLVATRVPAHTQVLNEEVCFLVDPEPDSLAAGILAALRGDERCRRVVAAARALYDAHYSRSAYEAKMRALLQAVS